MIEITTTTVTKEGVFKSGEIEYRVIYRIVNNLVSEISMSIVKESDGILTEVGSIKKEKGQVNSFIRETEDWITHQTTFKSLTDDIEKEVNHME